MRQLLVQRQQVRNRPRQHAVELPVVRTYKGNVPAVARHLRWPEAKVRAAVNYAEVFPEEVEEATSENNSVDFEALKRMLPQATEFVSTKPTRG